MPKTLTAPLRDEYATLFSRMQIRPERVTEIKPLVRRIVASKDRYQAVQEGQGVPWFVVAIIHNLECSGRFDRHLHNGDPLTARTVHVPAGRPRKGQPPFTWEDSAADALAGHGLGTGTDWSVPGIAFQLEAYNGWGYRNNFPQVRSPYLWSFSNIYDRGKYVADGRFSPDAVSQQCGGMVLLRALMDADQSIQKALDFKPDTPDDDDGSKDTPVPQDGEGIWPSDPPRFPGVYLRMGVRRNADVKRIQARLKEVLCDPGVKDGNFADATRLAVMLFQARSSDLSEEPLDIDGIVGPKTWGALFGPASVEGAPGGRVNRTEAPGALGRMAIEVAAEEVGVLEVPAGSNRGPRVEEYQNSVGSFCVGQAWCMCFMHWVFRTAAQQLGTTSPVPKTGGVLDAWTQSQKLRSPVKIVTADDAEDDPSLVEPGMAFFLRTSDRTGHTGLVVANFNGLLETIEGNTNNGGSREGIGVFRRRKRPISHINLGFISYG
jgi:lysozyme family protein/peptidoglycan hydrolase-like protein with peptidoglycan-binding domain